LWRAPLSPLFQLCADKEQSDFTDMPAGPGSEHEWQDGEKAQKKEGGALLTYCHIVT